MSTDPIHPLIALMEQAERERDEALANMERSRKAMHEANNQVQSLRQWRSDYQVRWGTQFQQMGRVEIVRCYQEFVTRLSEAIVDQEAMAEKRSLAFHTLRAQLQQCEQRVLAVAQLIERRQKELNLSLQRREQKSSDELASRLLQARVQANRQTMSNGGAGAFGSAHLWSGDPTQDFVNTLT